MDFDRQALTEYRVLKGWTQAELALRVGLSRPYINQIEAGLRQPSPPALQELARVLEVGIPDLMAENIVCPNCGFRFASSEGR